MEAIRNKTSKKKNFNLNGPFGRGSQDNENYWLECEYYG